MSEFGFSKSSGHSLEAFTKDHNVKFFVDPWKYNHYRYNQQKLRQLERRVERQVCFLKVSNILVLSKFAIQLC